MGRTSKFTAAQKAHFVAVAKKDGYAKAAKEAKVSGPTIYNWARAANGHAKFTKRVRAIKEAADNDVISLNGDLQAHSDTIVDPIRSYIHDCIRGEVARVVAGLTISSS